jgi:uncharacterized membrane protein YfcA
VRQFLVLALVGFVAQLVDGSLGMAYGVTSSTLLLAVGIAPAVASASVHLSEVGTTLVSGVAHWRLGNTDWRVVAWLAAPGGLGALAGALFLSSLDATEIVPWIAVFLTLLGAYVLIRFAFLGGKAPRRAAAPSGRMLAPLGLVAGFLDAVGGGGWGPISTPTLLATGRMAPRKVIGTVDTSEFVVALAASVGFLFALGRDAVALPVVGALLIGGVIAAPIAAWLVRLVHPRLLGATVGGLIVLTNGRTLLRTAGVAADDRLVVYAAIVLLWALAVFCAFRSVRAEGGRFVAAPAD